MARTARHVNDLERKSAIFFINIIIRRVIKTVPTQWTCRKNHERTEKIYDDASDKSPIDIRKTDYPEYLTKVFMNIEEKLTEKGFVVVSFRSEESYVKGTASRMFEVRPSGNNTQFSRANGIYKLETPAGSKSFHYGASNKNKKTQSRKEYRESSLNEMVEYIVQTLATQNLGIRVDSRKQTP